MTGRQFDHKIAGFTFIERLVTTAVLAVRASAATSEGTALDGTKYKDW